MKSRKGHKRERIKNARVKIRIKTKE